MVRLGPLAIGRAKLEPGWRWSSDVKPIVRTAWCQSHHLHVLLAGTFGVEMEDGERAEFAVGDVFEIPPGHDAWVVGAGCYRRPSSTTPATASRWRRPLDELDGLPSGSAKRL